MAGGSGYSNSQDQTGYASAAAGTGVKNINIGGNPNITSGKLNVAFLVAGAVVVTVAFFYFRKK